MVMLIYDSLKWQTQKNDFLLNLQSMFFNYLLKLLCGNLGKWLFYFSWGWPQLCIICMQLSVGHVVGSALKGKKNTSNVI